MSNSTTGFGFRQIGSAADRTPSFGEGSVGSPYPILSTYTTTIGKGCLVILSANGYIYLATSGDSPILGVFDGCSYVDTNQTQRQVQANAWTGSTTSVAGTCYGYVIDDPASTFQARVSGGPLTFADVGANLYLNANGTVNAAGESTDLLYATVTTSTQAPFKLVSVVGGIPVNNDSSSSYNIVVVRGNSIAWQMTTSAGTV